MIKNEKGMSLIEVLIALAILGIVAAAFLSGMATASRALIIADERTTAESLAKSQMEFVKNNEDQPYEFAPDGGEVSYDKIDVLEGYTIWSINRAGNTVNGDADDDIIAVPWYSDLPFVDEDVDIDAGLQKIRLIIKHHGKEVITLEGYKVDR
jgi:prepilin-type N-terminal cleavage/methylation domain-containing protein